MTLVQRCAVATADSKLGGLIDKLIALRAEIDATLAELALHSEAPHAEVAGTGTVAAVVNHEPPAQGAIEPQAVALAVEVPAVALALAADRQSNSRDVAEEANPELTAPTMDQPGSDAVRISVALFAQPPVEASLVSAVAVAAAGKNDAAQALTMPATAKDDLTLLSSIDADLADRLNAQGIVAYAQIAAWSEQDVKAMSAALDIGRRISKENWIEQAALLSTGETTAFATRRDASPATDADAPPNLESPPAEKLPAAPAEVSAAVAIAPDRGESAQIIAFDPGMRRAKEAGAASTDAISQPRPRGRRRVGALILTAMAASLLAGVALTSDSGAFTEQARAAVSQSFRHLLDRGRISAPIDTSVLAPYMRPEPLGMPVPHATAEYDLLLRHRQSWPPGS